MNKEQFLELCRTIETVYITLSSAENEIISGLLNSENINVYEQTV